MGMAAPQSQQQQDALIADVFRRVDRDADGAIDAGELQASLANGTWRPFNMATCRLLLRLFDADADGRLTVADFGRLWPFVNQWTAVFRAYDKDSSGSMEPAELRTALRDFGYRLSDRFVDLLLARFDSTGRRAVLFDDFVQLCIVLQTLTAAFRDKDADRDGVVTVHYEEFLTMVFTLDLWTQNG